MELKNLKASLKFKTIIHQDFEKKSYIFKIDDVVFTIYKHSPCLVNMTGLKKFEEMKKYKNILEKRFKQDVNEMKIDNTFFSKKQKKSIDLNFLYDYLKCNKYFHVNYNVELFSGMYLHLKKKGMPTLLLFHTGSYILMGGKNMKNVYRCERFLNRIILFLEKRKQCDRKIK